MRTYLVLACCLFPSFVLAADLIAEPPAVEPAPVPHVLPLSWTGVHLGLSGSVAAGMADWTLRPSGSPDVERETRGGGGAYGVEAGFDVELDRLIVGAVADYRRTHGYTAIRMPNGHRPGAGSDRVGLSQDWEASLRARVGARFGRTLGYVHGGVVAEKARLHVAGRETELDTSYGVIGGVGLEHRLTPRLSVVSEYAHRPGARVDASAHGVPISVKRRLHELRTGVRVRF